MKKKRKTLKEKINWLFKTKKAKEYFIEERKEELPIWNEIFKYYKGRDSWKDIADAVYSEYIRLKKSNNWICKCITCWRQFKRKEIQNWHFITRWSLKYRFDDSNCYPQCKYCNVMLHWNYQVYTMRMIAILGKEKVLYMLQDKSTFEIKQAWYEKHIIQRYKEKKILEHNLK